MRARASYDGYSVKLPNSAGEMQEAGSLLDHRIVVRLIACGALRYGEELGAISVRLERKARGSSDGYWVAYKRAGGRLHKTYVCEADALDPYNLDCAYQRLMHNVALYQRRCAVGPDARPSPPQTSQGGVGQNW